MKTNTEYSITLDVEEMTILRDLVRIGMKSKYYTDYINEEMDDYECEDVRNSQMIAVQQFVNLCPVSNIESLFDDKLFEGVTV